MYRCLIDTQYTALVKALLGVPISELQRQFVAAARNSEDFVELVRGKVGSEGSTKAALLSEKLTESIFKNPPMDIEQTIYQNWKKVTPDFACRDVFWGEVTLQHIEAGKIEAYYLAANGGNLAGGRDRIDRALSSGDTEAMLDCIRTILRRMSGLRARRGNISVYVDCPFARAWQRTRWIEEVCSATGQDYELIARVLRLQQNYWDELVRLIVSRNSVLGSPKVRDTLVWVLADRLADDPQHPILKGKRLRHACRLLGIRCAWQELGIFEIDELRGIVEEVVATPSSLPDES